MITVIFAPDGQGKSAAQLGHYVIPGLRFTKRNICTNLAIKLPELAAYLEKTYPGENLDPVGRIRLLTDSETVEFWKYRGPFLITGSGHDPSDPLDLVEQKGENGVLYVIDEAGQAGFSAAGWAQKDSQGSGDRTATRGGRCLWYLEQHRKFGDDVVASTMGRFPTGIAKPFRDKARDFVRVKNGYQRQVGIFKARGQFTLEHYASEPGPNVEMWKKETFRLDLELFNCYDTAKGVGVTGSAADKGRKAKGIPVLWVFPLMIAAGSLVFLVPWSLGHFLSKHMTGASSAVHSKIEGGIDALGGHRAGAETGPESGPKKVEQPLPGSATGGPIPLPSGLYSGILADSRGVRVFCLDDGSWQVVTGLGPVGKFVLWDGRIVQEENRRQRDSRLRAEAEAAKDQAVRFGSETAQAGDSGHFLSKIRH